MEMFNFDESFVSDAACQLHWDSYNRYNANYKKRYGKTVEEMEAKYKVNFGIRPTCKP